MTARLAGRTMAGTLDGSTVTSPRFDALLRRCACTTSPEAAFWKGVVADLNEVSPNWGLDLNPGRGARSVEAFVYLIDTSNLWLASAAIPFAELGKRHDERAADASGNEPAHAAAAIADASSTGDPTASPETLLAFAASVRAIATSPVFEAAQQQECPMLENHHWMLLLYRLANGESIASVGHVDEPYAGMLDRATLLECVERLVEADLGSTRSAVSQAAKRAAGVRLAAGLRHVKLA